MRLLPHGGDVAVFDLQSHPGHGYEARGHDDRDERFPGREDAAHLQIVEVGRVGDGRRQPSWSLGLPGFRRLRFRYGREAHCGWLRGGDLFERREIAVGVLQGLLRGIVGMGLFRLGGPGLIHRFHRCRHGFLPRLVFRRQRRGRYGDATAAAHGRGRQRRGTGRVKALLLRGMPPFGELRPRVWMFGDQAHPWTPTGLVGHGVQLVDRKLGAENRLTRLPVDPGHSSPPSSLMRTG